MADTKKKKVNQDSSKLRIIISAFESKILDSSVKNIIQSVERLDAVVKGPVPLPSKTKRWTVNRSTFIYEESKEQYEMKTHRRMIDIIDPTQKVIEALTNLSLPSGVNVNVKMI